MIGLSFSENFACQGWEFGDVDSTLNFVSVRYTKLGEHELLISGVESGVRI